MIAPPDTLLAGWPDLNAALACDAGWRQRIWVLGWEGPLRPLPRPIYHCLGPALLAGDGLAARLRRGELRGAYLMAGGCELIVGIDAGGRPYLGMADLGGRGPRHATDLVRLLQSASPRIALTRLEQAELAAMAS